MSDLDRRSFLKGALAASAAAAVTPRVSAGAPVDDITWKPAPCRLCGVGCGLLLGIQGGRVVSVRGNPASPVNLGLACVKGYYAPQVLYGRDRITRAMVRRNGVLAAVPLGEALDLVAARLKETVQRHGADSAALYGSGQWTVEDAMVAARLFRGSIRSMHVDTSARLHSASADAGMRTTFGAPGAPGTYDDIEQADVLVLWNVNLAETDPVLFSRMLERRRTNPAVRIVELATLTSRTSYAADRSLLMAPRSEIAVANAICQEIVARGTAKRSFVDRYVTFRRGVAALAHEVPDEGLVVDDGTPASWEEYARFLADYAPERVQRLSGLPADEIRWLASLYADPARRVLSVWGDAVNASSRGTWANNALHNIHLLVGKVAAPGQGGLPVSGQPGGAALLDDGFAHRAVAGDAGSRRRMSQVWGVPESGVDARAASTAMATFRAFESGTVRFLWIQAANPMVSLPHVGRYRKAFQGGDRFVVVSEAYPTATTDIADVVLPAAMWVERDGVYVNGERRAQHFERLVRAPGDAASDATLMREVARRLAVPGSPDFSALAGSDSAWDLLGTVESSPTSALPSAESVARDGGAMWPSPRGAETRWRYNAAHDPAVDQAHGGFDFYGHADHRARIWLRPWEAPVESPDRAYPYWFTTGRVLEHWGTGSMTRRVPTLHHAVPHAYAELNPDDARRLGLRDGDRVRLTSRRGSLELEARVGYRNQPPRGQVFAPAFDEGALVNTLTLDAGCPISGQPDAGACAVRVELVRRAR